MVFFNIQDTHCTGKTGKMAKIIPCQGKHREFGNFAKTQGKQRIWFAQVGNSLILKVQDISIFAAKISIFLLSWISLPNQICVPGYVIFTNHVNYWHRENLWSDRENTGNLKMQCERVP